MCRGKREEGRFGDSSIFFGTVVRGVQGDRADCCCCRLDSKGRPGARKRVESTVRTEAPAPCCRLCCRDCISPPIPPMHCIYTPPFSRFQPLLPSTLSLLLRAQGVPHSLLPLPLPRFLSWDPDGSGSSSIAASLLLAVLLFVVGLASLPGPVLSTPRGVDYSGPGRDESGLPLEALTDAIQVCATIGPLECPWQGLCPQTRRTR